MRQQRAAQRKLNEEFEIRRKMRESMADEASDGEGDIAAQTMTYNTKSAAQAAKLQEMRSQYASGYNRALTRSSDSSEPPTSGVQSTESSLAYGLLFLLVGGGIAHQAYKRQQMTALQQDAFNNVQSQYVSKVIKQEEQDQMIQNLKDSKIEEEKRVKEQQLEKKRRDEDPMNMKTFMRIPYKRAPEDPSWMIKSKAGRRLDPIEVEELHRWKFDTSHK